MKKLVLSLCLLTMGAAHASEAVVLETLDFYTYGKAEARFEVNKELGRAWVVMDITEFRRGPRSDHRTRSIRELVPGLSYDAASRTIVYDKDGALHECAKVTSRGRSIFRYDKITPLNCSLNVKKAKKEVDDGFRVRHQSVMQAVLTY